MDGGAAAIEVLVQNLINVLKEEYFLIRGLDGEAQQLQVTLGMIQDYLNDAEKKSITEDAVKSWLRQLEAVAFDADNVLDELNYHLLHKKINKMKTSNPNIKAKDKILSCFSSCSHIPRRSKMAHTIKQINATFESMNKRATDLDLQRILVNAPAAAPNASYETDSFTFDPIFIGRDDDVPKLVGMLNQTQEDQIFSILALAGMGGMGKTTLTRKVFNHERVKARFGSLIWVHVSQTFDPIILFNKILYKLTKKTSDGVESRDDILEKLQEALKDKIYLLVLDDVWNEDVPKWEGFINSMSGVTSTKGNGIIITTRKTDVATKVKPFHIHHMSRLSDEDCWSIIKAKTFDGNAEVPSRFETTGRKIAERCQGLPLAANVVGGVLRCKSEEEWRLINENWVPDGEGGENISKILKLSYDHLSSPSLKKCFAYCSILPKGRNIVKQELIELWMAEGFLQPSRRDDMESVGKMFFSILLHNSLLLVAERDDYGDVKSCVMHDLVHDMASSVLGCSNNAGDSITPVRYMFHNEDSPIPKEVANHLRTLFLENGTSATIFSDFKCLHNLTLTDGWYPELPNSIRELIHLRNLHISETDITNLPEWIGELHHLETLRADSWMLKKLPSTLKYLINLRHLYTKDRVRLPAEIGRLTSLQTLKYFRVGNKKGYQIEELGSLKNLKGKLEISNLQKVRSKEEALKANIFEKPNLSELVLIWNEDERNCESVLEALQPHANANLKKLEICGFRGKRFPTWTEKMGVRNGPQGSWVPLDNLIEIALWTCLEIEEIPMLEHLPNLKTLHLGGLKKVKFINSAFNNLKSLRIEELKGLECLPDWLFYNNHNLSNFRIRKCPVLGELPDGLDTLNSLEELVIEDCPNLKSIGNPSSGGGQSQGILSRLSIKMCGGLMELPRRMLELWAPSLEDLSLEGLSDLKNMPTLIDCLAKSSRLKELRFDSVPNLMATGSVESWGLSSLRLLWIYSDANIDTVDGILQGCCNSLGNLVLQGMENWEGLPQSIQHLTGLGYLQLGNIGVEELPEWIGNLSSLTRLFLYKCKRLRRLPPVDALKRPTQLRALQIKDCPELHIDSEWRNHPNLTIDLDNNEL